MKCSKKSIGLAFGILWAVVVFLATIYVLIKGGGNTLISLQQFFWGYSISIWGAFIGLFWGFIYGFVLGWLFGLLHNWVGGCCKET
jgi:tetrahydromethanopterin S-methyltransferase subunit G